MNIVEPVLFQCKLNPLTTAICVPGSPLSPVSYGALEGFIHNVARTALKSGIAPGNVVATFISDDVLHTAVILGLMHARRDDAVAARSMPGRYSSQSSK